MSEATDDRALLAALRAARAARRAAALVTVVDGPPALLGKRLLVRGGAGDAPGAPIGAPEGLPPEAHTAMHAAARAQMAAGVSRLVEVEGLTLFVEVQTPPPHLIICGAGHIAVPLATMAALCAFDVTVIDDRASYATPARFPAAQVRVGDFRRTLAGLRAGAHFAPRTFLALVTRGHQHDIDCLLEVIDAPPAYVGMIGSRRRLRAVFDLLARDEGIARERLAFVHAPIGLRIGAQTPAEIAVAILAEMIGVLRGADPGG